MILPTLQKRKLIEPKSRMVVCQGPGVEEMATHSSILFFLQKNLLLLFFNKFINLRLMTLQYCSGFAIHCHESATGIHVFPILNLLPHPSPSHPSGSSQCTSPKHPVPCIEPGLAIHFTSDNTHVSVPFSQIILFLTWHQVKFCLFELF